MLLPSRYSFRLARKRALVTSAHEGSHDESHDENRRAFIRTLGIAGLGVVGLTMLPKKASALVLGGAPSTAVVGLKDSSNNRLNPAKEDGNLATLVSTVATQTTLAQVQTQTAKLLFDGSNNLYVQAASNFSSQLENASNTIINPATEDSLAVVKGQVNKFTFDGSGNLKTIGSGSSSVSGIVGVQDTTSTQVNPATDDSIVLLRRMVKIMESQASADSGNRQRITIDSLGPSTAVTTSVPVSGTLTVSSATLAASSATVGSVLLDGQGHQMFQDLAKTAYATGIRNQLTFV